jgi:hypothetical protein
VAEQFLEPNDRDRVHGMDFNPQFSVASTSPSGASLHVPAPSTSVSPGNTGTVTIFNGPITVKVDGTGKNGQQVGGEIVAELQRRAMATRGITTSFAEAN